jgi:malonyl-CoA decarboxylase
MSDTVQGSFLDRTLRGAWRAIAGMARGKPPGEVHPDLPDADSRRIAEQMRECLEARGGEVSARARAAGLGRTYLSLNREGRRRFLGVLAREITLDAGPVDAAIEARRSARSAEERQRAERALREAVRPPRYTLYTQFTALPEGVKFLVDLRAEMLQFRREGDSVLDVAEAELKSLLTSWFDVGFLELTRMEWDSSAAVLEKLIEYEAVHEISSWDDLKNRLRADRRCFAFFHPRMPNEPLIFVWVALADGMSDNIQLLLDTEAPMLAPETADTAVFYSISNTQSGLAGIGFGDFLIKRVAELLASEFKGLKIFATLSPVPGFRRWLEGYLESPADTELISASERKKLGPLWSGLSGAETLKALLNEPEWHLKPEIQQALEGPLSRLCARYLLEAKRADGFARDPVAHFHLSNGARVERLNWLGDTSDNGLAQSGGIMVNYRYELDEIEANHEAYKGAGEIRTSSTVRSLLRSKR